MFDAFTARPDVWARAVHNSRRSFFPDSTLVLVEGSTDRRMYSGFCNPASTHFFVFDGRQGVVAAARTLGDLSDPQYAGIIDADCDHLTGDYSETAGLPVARTDTHDSETLMLLSAYSIASVINRLAPGGWQEAHGGVPAIIDRALRAAEPIGLVKYLQRSRSLFLQASVSSRALDYARFITADMSCDLVAFVRHLADRSPNLDAELLTTTLNKELAVDRNRWFICRGHDVAAILAIGFSSAAAGAVTQQQVEDALREAYSSAEDFFETRLCSRLKELSIEVNGPESL